MNRIALITLFIASSAGAAFADAPSDGAQWKLVWSDEFQGNSIDSSKWMFERGNGDDGWGNHEGEYYTSRPENAYVADGMLHVRAMRESYNGFHYTSAKMLTRNRFSKLYGKFEFKAKLPVGKGMWPAIWMMPADEVYGGWPASGEIDIVEARGQEPKRVLGTLHFGSQGGHDWREDHYVFPENQSINEFHVYDLEWEPGVMRYYIDGNLYATKRTWWTSGTPHLGGKNNRPADDKLDPWPAPFDRPFYIIFNLAVGGDFLGFPDATTVFPQELQVKYVRVYDKVNGYGQPEPRQDK